MAPPPGLHEASNLIRPSPYGRLEVLQWKVANLLHFFGELELGHMTARLTYYGVDGPTLLHLIEVNALEESGVTKVQARKIKGSIHC